MIFFVRKPLQVVTTQLLLLLLKATELNWENTLLLLSERYSVGEFGETTRHTNKSSEQFFFRREKKENNKENTLLHFFFFLKLRLVRFSNDTHENPPPTTPTTCSSSSTLKLLRLLETQTDRERKKWETVNCERITEKERERERKILKAVRGSPHTHCQWNRRNWKWIS